jgi:hypothetical protein
MNDIVDFLEDVKYKPRDIRLVEWRTFCEDMRELTAVQKQVLREELLRRHKDASAELVSEFPDLRGWFREGAWQQSVLDEDLFNQLELLTLSFV